MQSTTQNNLNQKTTVPTVKPEVAEFFQREINPNMTPEQIKDVVDSLNPELNTQPNPIFGQIVNLLYQGNNTNLVSLVIQADDISGNIYTLSADPNINAESDIIDVVNLNDFQFRLQEAFNYQSLVNIYCEDNKIDSLVIVAKQIQEPQIDPRLAITIGGGGANCRYGSPPCLPRR